MKKICILMVLVGLILSHHVDIQALDFQGTSYIVMEASSRQVLEEKNMHVSRSVASISKIMTCIVALENMALDTKIEIGEEIKKAYGSGIYIHIGDTITLQDLLYGLMLRSGNDAALCIAYHVGGESIEHFVEMMNQKAQEIGMKDTVFHNPSGLDEEDEGNQSSAYDMALLMAYCSENPTFNQIVSTKSYKRLDGQGTWKNKNRLLSSYEYCVGGKTGFTKKAKRTLVTRAKKEDVSLIIVTLNCGNDFEFHQSKYEEYFALYEKVLVLARGVHTIADQVVEVPEDIYIHTFQNKDYDVRIEENVEGLDVIYEHDHGTNVVVSLKGHQIKYALLYRAWYILRSLFYV